MKPKYTADPPNGMPGPTFGQIQIPYPDPFDRATAQAIVDDIHAELAAMTAGVTAGMIMLKFSTGQVHKIVSMGLVLSGADLSDWRTPDSGDYQLIFDRYTDAPGVTSVTKVASDYTSPAITN